MHWSEKALFAIILFALCVSIGFNIHQRRIIKNTPIESYIDTIPYYYPVPKDSVVVRYVTQNLPVAPTNQPVKPEKDTTATLPVVDTTSTPSPDSVQVVIPITQKHYKEETYEAWVSGYMPQLDSINVYAPTTVVNHYEKTPWVDVSVGLQVGVGLVGKNEFAPYVGVGVQIGIPLRKIIKK